MTNTTDTQKMKPSLLKQETWLEGVTFAENIGYNSAYDMMVKGELFGYTDFEQGVFDYCLNFRIRNTDQLFPNSLFSNKLRMTITFTTPDERKHKLIAYTQITGSTESEIKVLVCKLIKDANFNILSVKNG